MSNNQTFNEIKTTRLYKLSLCLRSFLWGTYFYRTLKHNFQCIPSSDEKVPFW